MIRIGTPFVDVTTVREPGSPMDSSRRPGGPEVPREALTPRAHTRPSRPRRRLRPAVLQPGYARSASAARAARWRARSSWSLASPSSSTKGSGSGQTEWHAEQKFAPSNPSLLHAVQVQVRARWTQQGPQTNSRISQPRTRSSRAATEPPHCRTCPGTAA